MMRAQEADPSNLEVLLALGVSHTSGQCLKIQQYVFVFGIKYVTIYLSSVNNTELEQATALKYLYGWLRSHPKYGTIAPPELADSLYHADVSAVPFLL